MPQPVLTSHDQVQSPDHHDDIYRHIPMWEIVLSVIAGLVLFLFAVINLSDSIHKALGPKAQRWLQRFTSNTFSGILTGTIITMLLDSSSAVIIMTIILVNSKLLTFRQAMGIVLGANIGTTFSSQIIAMDVGKFSPILLLIGFTLLVISKTEKIGTTARIILFFGVMFFGLFTMEKAVEPLRENAWFTDLLHRIESPLPGALTGALVTLVIQSSSATVGMAIILAKKGLLGLSGGIAVMLGAELGTCSDTLLATIKGTRQALKTGLFHLTFNILSIILGLILFYPFLHFIQYINPQTAIEHSVANAHMIFNASGVLLFVWLIPWMERSLNRLLPEKAHVESIVTPM